MKILFVCLGNICRSPMAEFVMKDLVRRAGKASEFEIASAATSAEEAGSPVHPGTLAKLARVGIPTGARTARRMTAADYERYDLLLGMEERNLTAMRRIVGGDPDGKMKRLADFTQNPRDIADPWYTGDFDRTFEDILEGCTALLRAAEQGANR